MIGIEEEKRGGVIGNAGIADIVGAESAVVKVDTMFVGELNAELGIVIVDSCP